MLYDSVGNQIEGALTPDEAKALREKETQLEEFRLENEKLKEKDFNFANFRLLKEKEAEKKVEEARKEMDTKIEQVKEQTKKEVFESVLNEHYKEAIESLAGGDEELKKKLEHQYSRISDPITSRADIDRKLNDAWSLTQEKPRSNTNAFSSSGSSVLKPSASSQKFSEDEKAFAKTLAAAGGVKLTDEDFK